MEYTEKDIIAEEFFVTSDSLAESLRRLQRTADRLGVPVKVKAMSVRRLTGSCSLGIDTEIEIDGCFHALRLVRGTLENGVTHFNLEVE